MVVVRWSSGVMLACFCSVLMWAGFTLERLLLPEHFVRPVARVKFVPDKKQGFRSGHGWFENVQAGVNAQYARQLMV